MATIEIKIVLDKMMDEMPTAEPKPVTKEGSGKKSELDQPQLSDRVKELLAKIESHKQEDSAEAMFQLKRIYSYLKSSACDHPMKKQLLKKVAPVVAKYANAKDVTPEDISL